MYEQVTTSIAVEVIPGFPVMSTNSLGHVALKEMLLCFIFGENIL